MQNHIRMLVAMGGALIGTSCQVQPVETAVAGSLPAMSIAIGPIPGPPQQVALPSNPYGQDRVALSEGRKLFVRYNCSGCHGGHAGGGMGPSLRDAVWIYGGDDAHIFDSIAQGRANGMPSWGGKLPQEQIWKLTAYIKSMRTPLEPDPPEQE